MRGNECDMTRPTSRVRGRRRRSREERQRGAAMVEFALIAPFFITLIFGIMEFSWGFGQHLDMRHGAREGARLAAVDYDVTGTGGATQTAEIVAEICNRVQTATATRVALSFDASGTSAGDYATIEVERDLETITGFFDSFVGGLTPSSTVSFRLEQDANWTATAMQACP